MARVFVGNLPTAVVERDIESEFDKFGRVRSISVKFPQRPPPFAFIEYEDERDASDAVRSMHGREFHGSRLRVEISHGGGATRSGEAGFESRLRGTQYRVKVSNLATSVSWQDLKDFLRDGGDVAHADVDRRGNGVASFASHEDMERAIRKLDNTELSGDRVRIRERWWASSLALSFAFSTLSLSFSLAVAGVSQHPPWPIVLSLAVASAPQQSTPIVSLAFPLSLDTDVKQDE
ncbi:hypothetical protein Gpo141_00012586 [Globisporangium polare]